MIYSKLFKYNSIKPINNISHYLGEELLAYGLLLEKGILYKNEPVVKNLWDKPSLKNYPSIQYNISHSENYIVCVISDTYMVGIDVEKVRGFSPYAAKRSCSLEELEMIYSSDDSCRKFFQYWTLKESYIKAIGLGLSYPMKNVNFIINEVGEVYSNLVDCTFLLIEDEAGFVIGVCYIKEGGKK